MVQPTYPAGQGGPYQAAPPAAPVPTPGRTGAIAAALCVLLAGVIGGIVMLLLSGSRRDAAIDGLARAPIGCTTTLDFAKAGDFVVFVETRGSAPCVATARMPTGATTTRARCPMWRSTSSISTGRPWY
jgi:hypothetical protein